MKKTLITLFTAVALLAFKPIADSTWTVDPAHSKLGFSITHMMVSDVDGTFKSFTATVTSSKDDFSDAVVNLSADVASVSTDNDARDKHIKTPDFFDVEKYPKMTFKSTSFKKTGDKTYKVTGDLTLKGITKSVTLDATYRGTYTNQMNKKTVAGFKVTGVVKRKDFNIGANFPTAALSDEVTLTANTEFVKN
ncbi:YceI family protein [Mucilaginibacter boryungensis]|uniref:Polyisoprenoid-binding protein n=1 Tax=Mucilaginibacter boryungensis TaxID=768480 RepID=A0ABR9XG51_9SPHI|nr:YceI family protein [Mucilaginibacter boryungensis]MBE9666040.1 polyisoprenoid-binding protein [Mucilaginibacter boryungensis]